MKIRLYLIGVVLVFVSCSKTLSEEEKEQYLSQGKEIAMATANTLGSNLTQKMKNGGVVEAIPFCNVMAYPLTEQMSEKYNVSIKRTSHKIRNDINMPTVEESKIIDGYLQLAKEGKPIKPSIEIDKSGKPHFYAPILLQKKCLACHGTIGDNITMESDSIIKSYYGNDKAIGFKEGDLRGVWSIIFNK